MRLNVNNRKFMNQVGGCGKRSYQLTMPLSLSISRHGRLATHRPSALKYIYIYRLDALIRTFIRGLSLVPLSGTLNLRHETRHKNSERNTI